MARLGHVLLFVFFLSALIVVPYGYHEHQDREYRNFRVVRPGGLYRSGQLSFNGLRRVIHEQGIRTVITLREKSRKQDELSEKEEVYCGLQGIAYVRIPARQWWGKNGPAPGAKSIAEFLKVMRDPEKYPRPILLHCFAGEHRTGVFCAVYRMECEGWSNEDAINEMVRCGYVNFEREWDVRTFLRYYEPSWRRDGLSGPSLAHLPRD